MRVFPPPLEIGDDEGFDPAKDIFRRADFGHSLLALVSNVEDPLVILLDSPWGTGKTTFIKMWAGEARKAGHPVVYFDAFANDHQENAFLALAGEVIGASRRAKAARTSAYRKFLGRATKAGKVMLRAGTKIGIKAATLGVLDATDIDTIKNVAGDLADAAASSADDFVSRLLQEQAKSMETMSSFRTALSDLGVTLSDKTNEDGNSKSLVFIVDELDRCRPSFALDVIENIKHLFSVPNVHFILVAYAGQLENSIKYRHGPDIDSMLYLQKFYNVIVHLPEGGIYRSERVIHKYLSHLRANLAFIGDSKERDQMFDQLEGLAEAKGYSLRTVERIATLLNLCLAVTPANHLKLLPIVPGLVAMKLTAPNLFARAKRGTLAASEAFKFLDFAHWPTDGAYRTEWMQKWWTYCLENELPGEAAEWHGFAGDLSYRYNIDDRGRIVPLMATTVVDRVGAPG